MMYQPLREALSRAYIDTQLQPYEQKLATQLSKLFRRQGAFVVRRLAMYRSEFTEALRPHELASLLNHGLSVDMAKAIQFAIELGFSSGASDVLADVKADISFSLDNPRAVQYTKDYGANLVTKIDETTRSSVKDIVTRATANGTAYTEVAKQLKALFNGFAVSVKGPKYIQSRAELIAVTELGNAYQAGASAAVDEATDTGLTFEKYWLTSNDSKVSEGCRTNQSVGWISKQATFPSGHDHPLRFPGCRCVAQYRRKK
jgi:hypothetical protein